MNTIARQMQREENFKQGEAKLLQMKSTIERKKIKVTLLVFIFLSHLLA